MPVRASGAITQPVAYRCRQPEPPSHQPEAPARETSQPAAPVLRWRDPGNREAMVGTSPGRQSGVTAKYKHEVPEGRHASSDKMPVVPSGLGGVCRSLTMDSCPWLLHVMPSAFNSAPPDSAITGSPYPNPKRQRGKRLTSTRSASDGNVSPRNTVTPTPSLRPEASLRALLVANRSSKHGPEDRQKTHAVGQASVIV